MGNTPTTDVDSAQWPDEQTVRLASSPSPSADSA
jgi:hypothetical protein